MKFTLGLLRDRNPIDFPSGHWSDARNIILSKRDTVSNEMGNDLYGDYPDNLDPIGKYLLGQKIILFSVDKGTGKSEIGYLDSSGVYTTIIRTAYLGFGIDFPIQAEGQINYTGDEIIAWIDFKNPPRILNLTVLPFTLDGDFELINPELINATLIFQESSSARILVQEISDTGGGIRSGAVQFAVSYSNEGLARTDLFNLTRPVPITTSNLSGGMQKYRGVQSDVVTGKSIRIRLEDIDTRFDFVHIAVLRRNGGVLTLEEISRIQIEGDTLEYNYTGTENVTDIRLEELLVDRFRYSNAKAVTQVNDRIYLGNLKTKSSVNFQQYFLGLRINYVKTALFTTNEDQSENTALHVKNPINIHRLPTFMPGEVYAIYAAARLKDGSITPAYHIPGREVAPLYARGALTDAFNYDIIDGSGFDVWEDSVISADGFLTARTSGDEIAAVGGDSYRHDRSSGSSKYFQTRGTANNIYADTNMGYWENKDEKYPDTDEFGALRNTPVRHHKFPEVYEIIELAPERDPVRQKLYSLGIEVSNITASFPPEILDQIDSFELFYARKTISNSIILGQDITQFLNKETTTSLPMQPYNGYTGGNWTSWQQITNVFTTGQINLRKMRSTNFDIMSVKPNVTPGYLTFQYGLVSDRLAKEYDGDLDGVEVESFISGNNDDGTGRITRLSLVIDYSDNRWVTSIMGLWRPDIYIRKVNAARYLPANVNIGDTYNRWGNEHLEIETDEDVPNDGVFYPELRLRYSSIGSERYIRFNSSQDVETVRVYNICQVRDNLFTRFDSQMLISMGHVQKDLSQPFTVYGGDSMVSQQSVMNTAKIPVFDNVSGTLVPREEWYELDDANVQGIKVMRRFLGYFRGNPSYRHENIGRPNSFFFNMDSAESILKDYRRDLPEELLYNDDYSFKAEVVNISPHKPEKREATVFPTRIIRSVLQPRETVETQWNRFLPGDYYEHQKNRGEIVNLEADNDRLMIHCRYGLFVTRSSDTLTGNEADITISSGDIFALPPREIISSDTGYAGISSPFSAKKCKLGYVFADQEQGKIFIVSEGLDEISARGMRNFFAERLPLNTLDDRPYRDLGIIFEYDERFNRLLVTKKEECDSFTLSYSPGQNGQWVSFHDYIPDMYISDRKNMFTIKDSDLYIHNSPVREFYQEPFITRVDFVFAEPNDMTKSLASVKWLSETVNADLSQQRRTFNSVMVYNSYQCSGIVHLNEKNLSYVENEWRFNNFMDIVGDRNLPFFNDFELIDANINPDLPYFKQRKFIDKYFVVRMYYNNTIEKDIYLYSIDAIARKSAN